MNVMKINSYMEASCGYERRLLRHSTLYLTRKGVAQAGTE